MDGFIGERVVVTEKLDGENTTMYRDHVHARSLDSRHHPSRDWVKSFWGKIKYLIPEGYRICGENVYARHSIEYHDLESYFYGFSVWNEKNVCVSWDETLMIFEELGIVPAPTLYRGDYSEKALKQLAVSLNTASQEGFVVRVEGEVPYDEFGKKFAKWVRKGHVQTDEHWMRAAIVPNQLRTQS
jgi:hypothetical protein